MKLSPAQTRFLRQLASNPNTQSLPPGGSSTAGRAASAWYRTAKSLEAKGLVEMRRSWCNKVAHLTDSGRRALFQDMANSAGDVPTSALATDKV